MSSSPGRGRRRGGIHDSGAVGAKDVHVTAQGQAAGRDIINNLYEAHPTPQALNQLPRDLVDFTDRNVIIEEFRQVVDAAVSGDQKAPTVLALAGKPGVGKSAVMLHLAHQLRERFPDGQLYEDLRGQPNVPLDPDVVLGRFLRSLGIDGTEVPESLTEKAALYRSQLHGKRVLILLDSARDAGQIEPLLPANPECTVLITSQSSFAGVAGATCRDLDVLRPQDALVLLGKLVGRERVEREDAAASAIAQECGYLPLALRIAGGILSLPSRRRWSLAHLADRLADETQRLDQLHVADANLEIRSCFQLSYEGLTAGEARLFRRLGLLRIRDFAPSVAAAVLDMPLEGAEPVLDRLVDAHLIDVHSDDRYSCHNLLRLFAEEKAQADETEAEREGATRRALYHYIELATAADHILRGARAELAERLRIQPSEVPATAELEWFEAEEANLIVTIEQSYAAKRWTEVCYLIGCMTRFFTVRAHWDEWGRLAELGLDSARKTGDREAHAQMLNGLGVVHGARSDWQAAELCHRKALVIAQEIKSHRRIGEALGNLANCSFLKGEWEQGIEMLISAHASIKAVGDLRLEVTPLLSIGRAQLELGERNQARKYLSEALRIARDVGDRVGETEALSLLALALARDDEEPVDEAFARYQKVLAGADPKDDMSSSTIIGYRYALARAKEMGDPRGCAMNLLNLSVSYMRRGRLDLAISTGEEALAFYKESDDRLSVLHALRNLIAMDALWEPTKMLEREIEARAILESLDDPRREAEYILELGHCYAIAGREADARRCRNEAVQTAEQSSGPARRSLDGALTALDAQVRQGESDSVVSTPARSREGKRGRNEPCWCGSGRKFKHCHGE